MRTPGDPALALLPVHAAATWFMVGLIWTIQVVHYPGFAAAGEGGFADLHAQHGSRIGALLVLPWALEAAAAVGLVLVTPAGVPRGLAWVGLILVIALVVLTVLVFAPLHGDLAEGFDAATIDRLLDLNWTGPPSGPPGESSPAR